MDKKVKFSIWYVIFALWGLLLRGPISGVRVHFL